MKANEIREKTQDDLLKEVQALKSELYRLRFKQATNNLDNPMQLRVVRKDIARVLTILREIELKG